LKFVFREIIEGNLAPGLYNVCDAGHLSTSELYRVCARALNKKVFVVSVPESLIKFLFRLAGKSAMLQKLTEDMEISNKKLLSALKKPLPVSMEEGLTQTIQSFREQ
jgi:nucleoside-diphosphate-sugar epimerase